MASTTQIKYGLNWAWGYDPLQIEFHMIQHGGKWTENGQEFGNGLFFHYMEARALLWPNRYRHRWVELIYREILQNQMTILMGSASCGKTSTASEYALLDYFCFPFNTQVLVSTTTRDKLESAVFGEIKMLFKEAKQRYPDLPGNLIDHKICIATDDIEEDEVRDLRRGIIGKACYIGKQYVGLGVLSGIKQERIRFLADELSYMPSTFLDCLPNMFSNPDVKVIGSANPRHNPDDQLGIAAEPLEGWASVANLQKTTVWNTRFYNSRCVNLIGTDSPNFDVAEGQPEPFPRLIGKRFAATLEHNYGKNSPQFEGQVMGRMNLALAHSRVITRELCRIRHAHEKVIWMGTPLVKIKSIDPAYGGGDRCIEMDWEFGWDVKNVVIMRFVRYRIIQINLKLETLVEDQIAEQVKLHAEQDGTPIQNIFYDSFGRGTVGFAFSKIFGSNCPIPVDSGAQPTDRPVRQDLFVTDKGTQRKRLKRCDEHYSKFVTEMWFTVRYAIEAEQVRELPIDVMLEGCSREYEMVGNDRIEVEPKDEMRERTGKSPDLFDSAAIAFEGARRRGFQISKLGNPEEEFERAAWMDDLFKKNRTLYNNHQLTYK